MHFVFSDLVDRYSVDCIFVVKSSGQYIAGELVFADEIQKPIRAALISPSMRAVYASGGKISSTDRVLYIRKDMDEIAPDSGNQYYIRHKGKLYKVEDAILHGEDYADVNQYTLRRVSSFDA